MSETVGDYYQITEDDLHALEDLSRQSSYFENAKLFIYSIINIDYKALTRDQRIYLKQVLDEARECT
jgi:hypothetical protein